MNKTTIMLLALAVAVVCVGKVNAIDADLLLKGGTIFDGSGAQGAEGDVAITGDTIVAVGKFDIGEVGRVIECTGLVVAPGFIDLHTHTDSTILDAKTRSNLNYMTQGCTTVVTGNCGGGKFGVGPFLKEVDENGSGTNIIHLIPHGAVRRAVMKTANRAPTADEMSQMKELVGQGMREGAWGMSTGLIYAPSVYADTDELVELSKVVARYGGLHASHIRGEGDTLCEAVAELIDIGQRAKIPVHISHFKVCGKPNWGKLSKAVALIEAARSQGQIVTADQYPYIATSTSLFSILMPVAKIPGGWTDLSERMENDAQLAKHVRQVIQRSLDNSQRVVIASCSKFPRYSGRSVRELAAEEGIDAVDLVLRIQREGKASAVNFTISEDDVRYAMTRPWVATASDGQSRLPSAIEKFHPRNFGTFPRKIGYYALDQKAISLSAAIRSCSGLPADILGLARRGYLRPGAIADVLVFDPKNFLDQATFQNPDRYSTGVRYLFVAGQLALTAGQLSEELYGRALRHRTDP